MVVSAYSVVIPAYNAAATIAETVQSVLAQSVRPERIYVIDDGSADDTVAVASGLGPLVEVTKQANAGPGAATTRGFSLVQTPFVATLDADDLWQPDKIERQLASMAADAGIAASFTRIAEFRDNPEAAQLETAYDGWNRTTMLVRTDVARSAGPMVDPPGRAGETIDWLSRLREAGHRLVMMPDVLALRRVHAGSLSNRSREELGKAYLQVAREALLRKRNAGGKT